MATTNGDGDTLSDHVHVSKHPIISHKITILRSSTTHAGTFRAVLKEVTYHLGYEATLMSLSTKQIDITVPSSSKSNNNGNIDSTIQQHIDAKGYKLKERVSLIPIMRSGLGMVDSMLELIPTAQVHHIGMYKNRGDDQRPVQYYNRLPRKCQADIAYVMDALIATASSITSVVSILKKWGVPNIHVMAVIGSKSGIKKLMDVHPDIHITVGCIDEIENGQIIPGLGDSGDRLFGTAPIDDDDEALMHPSRRKRTLSQSEP